MKEFAHQARLAHPRFADDRHHLAVTLAGKLLRAAKLLQLDIAANEARQTTFRGDLKASPRVAGTRYFVDLYRIGDPLHRHRAEGLHRDVAFRQLEGVGGCKHGTGCAICSKRAAKFAV